MNALLLSVTSIVFVGILFLMPTHGSESSFSIFYMMVVSIVGAFIIGMKSMSP